LGQIVGPFGARGQLEAKEAVEGVSFVLPQQLNFFNLSADKEVRVYDLLRNRLRQISNPELSHSHIGALWFTA